MKYLATAILLYSLLGPGCSRPPQTISGDTRSAQPVRISSDGVAASEPAVTQDSVGLSYVVYVEHLDKNADVFLQKIDQGGRAIGGKVRVNPNPGEAKAWNGDPPTIAIGAGNTIYVGWTRKLSNENEKGNDLLVSVSSDGGATFGLPVKVNDDAGPASHGMHSLAVDKAGKLHLAWLDERNITKDQRHDMTKMDGAGQHHEEVEPNSEVFYSTSSDGGKTFAANKKIATEVCPCCKTSLLAASDGNVYVGWRQVLAGDHRHISVAHSNDGGTTFSAGVVVSDDDWQLSACPVSGAALASSAPNTLDVIWYTAGAAGQAGVYFTRSTDGGQKFGGRLLVSNEAGAGTPTLMQQTGKSIAVFPALDGGMITANWADLPTNALNISKTGEATAPAAANGIRAFVREFNAKSAVWISVG